MSGYIEADFVTSRRALQSTASINDFLAGAERRAYQMARVGTGDPDAALDIVQDAMFKLVKKYRHRPAEEWPPLFYRILGNGIKDWHRQRHRGWKVFDRWLGDSPDDGAPEDPIEALPALANSQPENQAVTDQSILKLESAVRRLPHRQQQAFMLRCWEGLSTREAATAMACTEGTVKTLYSRALHTLRIALEPQT